MLKPILMQYLRRALVNIVVGVILALMFYAAFISWLPRAMLIGYLLIAIIAFFLVLLPIIGSVATVLLYFHEKNSPAALLRDYAIALKAKGMR